MTNLQPLNVCILQPHPCEPNESPIAATEKVIRLLEAALEHYHDPARKESEDPVEAALLPMAVEAPGLRRDNKTIDLVLLPKLCPVGRSAHPRAGNKALHREIECRLRCAAKRFGCAICYGTMEWSDPTDHQNNETSFRVGHASGGKAEKPFFRWVVINAAGIILHSTNGDYPVCFSLPRIGPGGENWTLGLLGQQDLGKPGFVRLLVQKYGVHAVFQPTSFVGRNLLGIWHAFKEKRSSDHCVYYLASNFAGKDSGGSSVSSPLDEDETHTTTVLGERESYLLATLDPKVVDGVRNKRAASWSSKVEHDCRKRARMCSF